jgi:hypothetical protein
MSSILYHHHVDRIRGPLIDRLQHSSQRLGVLVPFVLFQLNRSRNAREFRRENGLHAMSHVHPLADDLLNCVGNRSHFHVPELSDEFSFGRSRIPLSAYGPSLARNDQR